MTSPEQLHVDFQQAFNRHDCEALVAMYEPEAILLSAGGTVQGREAIRELYRRVLASRPTIELRTLQATRVGEIALLFGNWTLHETGPDGAPVRRKGRNTETVRLQQDGRWLFVIDHPSLPGEEGNTRPL
jgi:uncharacterized protein (TIGR02246 family)